MRRLGYILTGVLVLVLAVFIAQTFSLFPAGIFNSAQVLSIIVLNPDGSCPLVGGCTPVDNGGGDTGGGDTGGGGTSGGGGGASSGGGGGGGAAPPPAIVPQANGECSKKGDLNNDGKVNIVDFSILAYWYKRTLTSTAIKQCIDLNNDGKVTLADFSILAYYWSK